MAKANQVNVSGFILFLYPVANAVITEMASNVLAPISNG